MIPGNSVGMSSAYSYSEVPRKDGGLDWNWSLSSYRYSPGQKLILIFIVAGIISLAQLSSIIVVRSVDLLFLILDVDVLGRDSSGRPALRWTLIAAGRTHALPLRRQIQEKARDKIHIVLWTWIVVVEEEEYEILSIPIQDQTRKERMISGSDNTV